MNNLNIVGRLTKKAEMKGTVALFTVAVSKRVKEGDSYKTEADFIPLKAFGKTAENLAKYSDKGMLVSIEGKIQTGSYMDNENNKKYTVDLVANKIQYLSKGSQAGDEEGITPVDDGDMAF